MARPEPHRSAERSVARVQRQRSCRVRNAARVALGEPHGNGQAERERDRCEGHHRPGSKRSAPLGRIASRGEREHPSMERGGRLDDLVVIAGGSEQRAIDPRQRREPRGTGRAACDVREDLGVDLRVAFVAWGRDELLEQRVGVVVSHGASSSASPARRIIPRRMRALTVPRGSPSFSAI